MDDHFPQEHIPEDHLQPMFTISEHDAAFGEPDQIHQSRLLLSCYYDDCRRCTTKLAWALAESVEDVMVLMRIVTACVTNGKEIFPAAGSEEENTWRAKLREGWPQDAGTPLYQRCGIVNVFCGRFVEYAVTLHPCGTDCRHNQERKEMWDAIGRRER